MRLCCFFGLLRWVFVSSVCVYIFVPVTAIECGEYIRHIGMWQGELVARTSFYATAVVIPQFVAIAERYDGKSHSIMRVRGKYRPRDAAQRQTK